MLSTRTVLCVLDGNFGSAPSADLENFVKLKDDSRIFTHYYNSCLDYYNKETSVCFTNPDL